MYKLDFAAYCGMTFPISYLDDRAESRAIAARKIRAGRRRGRVVTVLDRGKEWEMLEPVDSLMVPDDCGTLHLSHITFECDECGHGAETRAEARECCRGELETFDDQDNEA